MSRFPRYCAEWDVDNFSFHPAEGRLISRHRVDIAPRKRRVYTENASKLQRHPVGAVKRRVAVKKTTFEAFAVTTV